MSAYSDYNTEKTFSRIEDDIIDRLFKTINNNTHRADFDQNKVEDWYLQQLQGIERFKKENTHMFKENGSNQIYNKVNKALKESYDMGYSDTKKSIENKLNRNMDLASGAVQPDDLNEVRVLNDRKLNALVRESTSNIYDAQYSAVRFAEDEYRKIIYDANTYFNIDGITLAQAMDMATKDFLFSGINNIEYKDGRRINIQSYSEMAMRTSNKRAYMQGEAKMRDEFGTNLVIVTRRGDACPRCMQFVGRVYVDDVYSCVKTKNNKYPRLSSAISGGLYHPNCRDVHTTYFEGDTTVRKTPTPEEIHEAKRVYKLEQKQRYYERQVRAYDRLENYSYDADNKETYAVKKREWQGKLRDLVDSDEKLKRRYYREKNYGITENKAVDPKPGIRTMQKQEDMN